MSTIKTARTPADHLWAMRSIVGRRANRIGWVFAALAVLVGGAVVGGLAGGGPAALAVLVAYAVASILIAWTVKTFVAVTLKVGARIHHVVRAVLAAVVCVALVVTAGPVWQSWATGVLMCLTVDRLCGRIGRIEAAEIDEYLAEAEAAAAAAKLMAAAQANPGQVVTGQP